MNSQTCSNFAGHVREPLAWMAQQLETVFGELGIAQYLNVFIDQGFDTWETILDITESDLYVTFGAFRVREGLGCADTL